MTGWLYTVRLKSQLSNQTEHLKRDPPTLELQLWEAYIPTLMLTKWRLITFLASRGPCS